MVDTTRQPMAWGGIILCLILFWPLGLFFLFRRISSDRCAILQNARTVARISYVLLGASVVYIVLAVNGGLSYLIPAALTGGGGLWLHFTSRNMRRTGERYKKYIALVVNHAQTSIDAIASAVGVSYHLAVADLQKMIDRGYFKGAYIDVVTREIHLTMPPAPFFAFDAQAQHTAPQERILTCRSCGANNRVTTQIGACAYCGTPLQ